jgi:hypothetical protein
LAFAFEVEIVVVVAEVFVEVVEELFVVENLVVVEDFELES